MLFILPSFIFLVFCVVLLCVFTYWVLCCPVMCLYVLSSVLWCQLHFPHKKDVPFVFTSSRRAHILFALFVLSGVQHILCFVFLHLVYPMLPVSLDWFCFVFLHLVYPMLPVSLDCFCFVFLRLVYPMLPVSLDCPFFIAPSVFSNIYWLSQSCIIWGFVGHTIQVKSYFLKWSQILTDFQVKRFNINKELTLSVLSLVSLPADLSRYWTTVTAPDVLAHAMCKGNWSLGWNKTDFPWCFKTTDNSSVFIFLLLLNF